MIGALLQGTVEAKTILGILVVKSIIWSVSLGSGTSGGVLAPLLMLGGALGGLEALVLPNEGAGFWPLVSMGAILGGTMRSPFTGVIFSLELTHDVNVLLPLLVATTLAHGFTVLALRRSILTEKVSRRGYHLSREYAIDPLEILFVREVMQTQVFTLPPFLSAQDVVQYLPNNHTQYSQRLYPVVENNGRLIGVITQHGLQELTQQCSRNPTAECHLSGFVESKPVVAHPDESLRVVVYRMAETGVTRLPVLERGNSRKLLGMISLRDLLQARVRNLEAEQRRERIFPLPLLLPRRAA
jgi:CBS domain-containing protein